MNNGVSVRTYFTDSSQVNLFTLNVCVCAYLEFHSQNDDRLNITAHVCACMSLPHYVSPCRMCAVYVCVCVCGCMCVCVCVCENCQLVGSLAASGIRGFSRGRDRCAALQRNKCTDSQHLVD